MRLFWYRVLAWLGKSCGIWLFALVARIIAAGYFLFSSRSRKESVRLYGLLFPRQGRIHHYLCAFRQFQNFTTIHQDRLFLESGNPLKFTSTGLEQLTASGHDKGIILLMSHLGNWEMAACMLGDILDDARLMLYMGVKEKEALEGLQKEGLRKAGIRIVGIRQGAYAPLSLIDGIEWLRRGGIVSLTGDILWHERQSRVEVPFLGRRAVLPAAPYILALSSGAPLHVFFSFREGNGRYRFSLSGPIHVRAASRSDRAAAITRGARHYAALLEQNLRQHPFEWYHFRRFVI